MSEAKSDPECLNAMRRESGGMSEITSRPLKFFSVVKWLRFALWISLVGFWLVSSLPYLFGTSSRVFTLPFRAVQAGAVFLAGFGALVQGAKAGRRLSPIVAICCTFWIFYAVRILSHTVLNPPPLAGRFEFASSEILLFYFLLTVPCFFSFLMWPDPAIYSSLIWPVLTSTLVSILACLPYNYQAFMSGNLSSRVAGNDVLNPITFGHMGGACVLLALVFLLNKRFRAVRYKVILGVVCLLVGLATLMLSVSRGAIIDVFVLACFYVIANWKRIRIKALASIFSALLVGIPLIIAQVAMRGVKFSSFIGSADVVFQGASALAREQVFHSALEMFYKHPFLGGGLFQLYSYTYPHNSVLEAFMTTGIVGGLLYSTMFAVGVWRAVVAIKNGEEYDWICLLFLDYAAESLVSGVIFPDATFFGLLGILLGMNLRRRLIGRGPEKTSAA